MIKAFFRNNWQLLGILILYFFVAFYQLQTIPGEIWGDAIYHYYLAQKILHGHFFFNYEFGGDGPIFSYFAAFVSFFLPLSFYSLKVTAVGIGFFFVLSMYFLAKEFFHNKSITLLSTIVSAISFWTIVFVRQPHARILVPLFICLSLIATLKKRNTIAGILLGFGMYTQASFWGMLLTYWRNFKTLLIGIALTIPLAYAFVSNPVNFFSKNSYFGEKLAVHTPFAKVIYAILYNIQANLLSFTFRGDKIFRMNIPDHPHLDFISGILFVFGFLLILYECLESEIQKIFGFIRAPFGKNKIVRAETEKNFSYRVKKETFLLYFILPFFFIQIPSFLDIHNYFSQPNISRMIGVIPFVYISIAYAIFKVNGFFTSKVKTEFAKKMLSFFVYYGFLALIFMLNFYNYFVIYPRTLPNGNTPFGKLIAQTIDASSLDTYVVILGAGWGQYAQPEVAGIPMVQKTVHQEVFYQAIRDAQGSLCKYPQRGKPILIAANPAFQKQLQSTNLCMKKTKSYMLRSNGWQIAYILQGSQ